MADFDPRDQVSPEELRSIGQPPSYGAYLVVVLLLTISFVVFLVGLGVVVIRDSRDRVQVYWTATAISVTNRAVQGFLVGTATAKAYTRTTTPTLTRTATPMPTSTPTSTATPVPTTVAAPTDTPTIVGTGSDVILPTPTPTS